MTKRLKAWYDTVGRGVGDIILLAVLLYGEALYCIETTYKRYRQRRKIARIHRENPEIADLTKLSGIKRPD